jgi:protein-S-isoprenylcysteine O-methyltransferase Ste14
VDGTALWKALGTVLFFLLAPGTVAGLVPWRLTGWRLQAPLLGWAGFRVIGAGMMLLGLTVLMEAFVRFVRVGQGTPAPTHPTERLVVSGIYRYVRNPMYLAVLTILIGQGLLFGTTDLLIYAAVVSLGFHTFVTLYEEPTLHGRFGEEYERYCHTVPRWRPRLTPWARGCDCDAGDRPTH